MSTSLTTLNRDNLEALARQLDEESEGTGAYRYITLNQSGFSNSENAGQLTYMDSGNVMHIIDPTENTFALDPSSLKWGLSRIKKGQKQFAEHLVDMFSAPQPSVEGLPDHLKNESEYVSGSGWQQHRYARVECVAGPEKGLKGIVSNSTMSWTSTWSSLAATVTKELLAGRKHPVIIFKFSVGSYPSSQRSGDVVYTLNANISDVKDAGVATAPAPPELPAASPDPVLNTEAPDIPSEEVIDIPFEKLFS